MAATMLIRGAEVWQNGIADLRLAEGLISEIGLLEARPGEHVLNANGGALLPGLHDHHIHLAGLAARSASVVCGPPEIEDAAKLAARLRSMPGTGWLRGILYHESLMGLPDARELDAIVTDRPLRIQHRSGRMWLFNTHALEDLLSRAAPPPGLERDGDRFTGRLFDSDAWLREALGSVPPDLSEVSGRLAAFGVTGVTDMTPQNDPAMASHFGEQIETGILRQRLVLSGSLALAEAKGPWQLGPVKLHLHEADLPDFDAAVRLIAEAHRQARPVAVHCVSEVELVFALAVLEEAGAAYGDRIEHASVASDELVERLAANRLHVCVQPHFVTERGDRYLTDVEPRHHADLYRLASLTRAGLSMAGGSDAPFGSDNPWSAMAAAVSRQTAMGQTVGANEALTPEQALALFLANPLDLSVQRRIAVGAPADLVLLNRPWIEARGRLNASDVRATLVGGRLFHDRVDQAPG